MVATNARLSKPEATKVAQMAHDGLARAIRPAHTMLDGDTIFALSTGRGRADVTAVGAFAAEVVAQAVLRAVRLAASAGGLPGLATPGSAMRRNPDFKLRQNLAAAIKGGWPVLQAIRLSASCAVVAGCLGAYACRLPRSSSLKIRLSTMLTMLITRLPQEQRSPAVDRQAQTEGVARSTRSP